MRAITFVSPRLMETIEVSDPVPAHDEVLLRVERVGFSGSDLSSFRGTNPLVSYPRIPGHEIQAVVAARGDSVDDRLRLGQPVTVIPYTHCGECGACMRGRPSACRYTQTLGVQRDGALCELLCVRAENVLADERLSRKALALVEPLAVAAHAVDRGRVEANDTVLVIGCGMIGLGVVAAASTRGARVIAVDIDEAKLKLAGLSGATALINTAAEPLAARLSELTAGDGPDVTIEAVGLPQTFAACIEQVRYGGRVVYIGYTREPVPIDTKWYMLKELDVMGARNATRADFDRAMTLLAKGSFPVEASITTTVGFGGVMEAMQAWDRNPSLITKIHVDLQQV